MNVRSSHFTLELEDVLRFMARQPRLPIAYCARRYDVEKEKVVAWLAEFNSGQRPLTEKRIDEVLRELGAGKAEAPKAVRPAAAAVKTAPVAQATPPPRKARAGRAWGGHRTLARGAAREDHRAGNVVPGRGHAGHGHGLAWV